MLSKARLDSLGDISLLIAAVGLRLVLITPHLEQGDHLRHRRMSAILLMGSSPLNFVGPLLRRWRRGAVVLD
jgi:hypothetical protein